jgi:hypothetical protein
MLTVRGKRAQRARDGQIVVAGACARARASLLQPLGIPEEKQVSDKCHLNPNPALQPQPRRGIVANALKPLEKRELEDKCLLKSRSLNLAPGAGTDHPAGSLGRVGLGWFRVRYYRVRGLTELELWPEVGDGVTG